MYENTAFRRRDCRKTLKPKKVGTIIPLFSRGAFPRKCQKWTFSTGSLHTVENFKLFCVILTRSCGQKNEWNWISREDAINKFALLFHSPDQLSLVLSIYVEVSVSLLTVGFLHTHSAWCNTHI